MSKIYFFSDTHFGHNNVAKWRGFNSSEEHDALIIENWNKIITKKDVVYVLGDITMEKGNYEVLKELKGVINVVLGNHDKVIRNSREIQSEFESVQEYKVVRFNKEKFILCHFPFRQWDSMHHGSIHLYGHCHGNIEGTPHGRSMDVGIDARPAGDMKPWSVDEVLRVMKNRQILEHH